MKINPNLMANLNGAIDNSTANGTASTRKLNAVQEESVQKAAQTKPDQLPQEEDLEKALGQVKQAFEHLSEIGFEYSIDKDTNREVVKIYDKQTKEVIRQYPPKEILSMLARMTEMMGFLVDTKV